MNESAFFQDLAVLMAVAGAVTVVFTRFKWPKVIGYLLAGILLEYPLYRAGFRREYESLTDRAVKICRDHPTGYLPFQVVAKLYMLEKNYRMASSYFRRSLQFVNIESEWQVLNYYALCERALGNVPNALEIADRAAALKESDPHLCCPAAGTVQETAWTVLE